MERLIHMGTCELCGHRDPSSEMVRHLETCAAVHDRNGPPGTLFTLVFEGADDPRYWIHVAVRADANLEDLDNFLREIWLECCGHESVFTDGNKELDMGAAAGTVLGKPGLKLRHEYDLGSTTVLNVRVRGARRGSIGPAAVRLLARNDAPIWKCEECEKPGKVVCPSCGEPDGGVLCAAHARKHEHAEEDAYLPVVNSPRMGRCAYTGPA